MTPFFGFLLRGVLAGALAVPALPGAADDTFEVQVEAAVLGPAAKVPAGYAFVAGRVSVGGVRAERLDVMFVIDRSGSTKASAGTRRSGEDAPGVLARIFSPGDNILEAEVAAVRTLLPLLEAHGTRIGVISFSDEAFVDLPLSRDLVEVREALDALLAVGPDGATNMRSALLRGTVELIGSRRAESKRRKSARRVMIFLTDGVPTRPESSAAKNASVTLGAARRAAKHDITIHTFGIGAESKSSDVPRRIAKRTRGTFTQVEDLNDLPTLFERINFADVESVTASNLTSHEIASEVEFDRKGRFAALVPVRDGKNTIEVTATSNRGDVARARLELGDGKTKLSRVFSGARDRLVERRRQADQRRESERRRELEIEAE